MLIYLCAAYERRLFMLAQADALESAGHSVVSRWVFGEHEGGALTPEASARYAREDLEDLDRAHVLIAMGEHRGRYFSGGRHVELGYALARRKIVILVGPAENVFHHSDGVHRVNTWGEVLPFLDGVVPGTLRISDNLPCLKSGGGVVG